MPQGFAVDGVASSAECAELVALADAHARPGEGYGGDEHYLGAGESYLGLMAVPTDAGGAPLEARLRVIALVESMRRWLVRRTGEGALRCGTAFVTKRTGVEGAARGALSHPWHRDHDTRGEDDAWRLYTAVLYLNDGFEGGELAFPLDGREAWTCEPRVGRMVAFDGRQEHGVLSIVSGTRYTLVGWYGLAGPGHPPLPAGYLR